MDFAQSRCNKTAKNKEGPMSLSKRVVETLIDLVEIKLSCFEVYDREDKREIAGLQSCRQELQDLLEGGAGGGGGAAVAGLAAKIRGRPRVTA
jgi:hypothetical protein